MSEKGGRKLLTTYRDGDMWVVKSLTKLGHSYAIVIPGEWLNNWGGTEAIKSILLKQVGGVGDIIIRPCFEDIPTEELSKL